MRFAQPGVQETQERKLPRLEPDAAANRHQFQTHRGHAGLDPDQPVFSVTGQERIQQQFVSRARQAQARAQRQPDACRRCQGDRRLEAEPVQHHDHEQRPGQLVPPAPLAVGNLAVERQQHDQHQRDIAELAHQARPVRRQRQDRGHVPGRHPGLEHQVHRRQHQRPDAQPLVHLVHPVQTAEQVFKPAPARAQHRRHRHHHQGGDAAKQAQRRRRRPGRGRQRGQQGGGRHHRQGSQEGRGAHSHACGSCGCSKEFQHAPAGSGAA